MPFKQDIMTSTLPIYEIIPKLKDAFVSAPSVVLQAPPGAGKTTVVPLELINEPWMKKKRIVMLEPRRLAARSAAHRMAHMLGEKVGETVGYRVRMDSQIGPNTRIEVVTEGILNRQLQNDPELSGVGLVIFDEFHERSIDADLGLALTLDVQGGLRDDLKVLVMSATLDGQRVANLMDNAPLISSQGRAYDVAYRYLDKKPRERDRIEHVTGAVIDKALNEETGSILVFLPGAGEIERTRLILEDMKLGPDVIICPLYGMMSFKEQDQAISPAQKGKRKVVLATAIAETSLTIEGIRVVIDSGQMRLASYDTRSGMSGLVTTMVSKASADQRAGRAGRLEEGVCYRLWTQAANRALVAFSQPEIKRVDLAQLVLNLSLWGVGDVGQLTWLDMPDSAMIDQAKSLLVSLEALDENGAITEHGKRQALFPMHPRLAHMIIKSQAIDAGLLALYIAALMEERDILNQRSDNRSADIRLRLEALLHIKNGENREAERLGTKVGPTKRLLKQIKQWQRIFKIKDQKIDLNKAGLCLAFAFPDRIGALRHNQTGSYLLSGGRGAKVLNDDPLGIEKFIAIGSLDKGKGDARIFLGGVLERDQLEEHFKHLINDINHITWDDRHKQVRTEMQHRLGVMPISTKKAKNPDGGMVKAALLYGISKMGLECLPWDKKSAMLRRRVMLLKSNGHEDIMDLSDEWLLANLEEWLGPYVDGILNKAALSKLDITQIIMNTLDYNNQQKLNKLVPTHIRVPSGSNIAINYENEPPTLEVKLQEMFGATESPSILNGKVPLTVHLLSPARRPLQITTDLKGFWKNSYIYVKKEMKGRYPKHPWPDDPMQALPTKKLKAKVK
ncbi:MAG: ATP-dependent helicase HrpB [Emcibacteraceae bacterium]|nr:ATP-dependent helicase HrpB [Emcibacteraceae bacterium]MDG1997485.1 ATP-dependent helicase HrpB [Emcibacteraceae bacterium]